MCFFYASLPLPAGKITVSVHARTKGTLRQKYPIPWYSILGDEGGSNLFLKSPSLKSAFLAFVLYYKNFILENFNQIL